MEFLRRIREIYTKTRRSVHIRFCAVAPARMDGFFSYCRFAASIKLYGRLSVFVCVCVRARVWCVSQHGKIHMNYIYVDLSHCR